MNEEFEKYLKEKYGEKSRKKRRQKSDSGKYLMGCGGVLMFISFLALIPLLGILAIYGFMQFLVFIGN